MTAGAMTNEPEIAIRPDPEACARTAADLIASALMDAADQRERAHWATTGGSTCAPIYRNLALPPLRDRIPWDLVELWWGDERFVPADHPLSNAKIALDDLIEIGALSGESGTGHTGRTSAVGGPPVRRSPPKTSTRFRRAGRSPTASGRSGRRNGTRRCFATTDRSSTADGPPST